MIKISFLQSKIDTSHTSSLILSLVGALHPCWLPVVIVVVVLVPSSSLLVGVEVGGVEVLEQLEVVVLGALTQLAGENLIYRNITVANSLTEAALMEPFSGITR